MQLVLIRHGESEANRQGVVQGHFDSPLSPTGQEQAEALAEALAGEGFSALYASDLQRAQDTARAIAHSTGLPLHLDPDVREIDIGIFSGMSWATISQRFPEAYARFKETNSWAVVPGAEQEDEARDRLERFLAKVRAQHPTSRVAIVAHGAILRRMIHVLLGLPFPSGVFFELFNASYSEVHLTDHGPTLLYLNRLASVPVSLATTRALI
jgi:probable phosphoglycerate mutase